MRQPAHKRTAPAERAEIPPPAPAAPTVHVDGNGAQPVGESTPATHTAHDDSNGAQPIDGPSRPASPQAAAPEPVDTLGGVYFISVASRILKVHPQTLRKYERLGLVKPTRSIGMLRLYSAEDVLRVRLIRYMVDSLGMNLAGVEFALSLVNRIIGLRQRVQSISREDATAAYLERELDEILRELGAVFPNDLPRV